MRRIVVVGASLAGLRAAEELRAAGFDGDLDLVGAEHHPPYNRPPLSKGLLVGDESIESTALSGAGDLEARWWLGREARALDLCRREVMLDGGDRLQFDGLIIASGARARLWPAASLPSGVLTLRTLDDSLAVRDRLRAGVRRVVVIGAGFIGGEVASSCVALGVPVSVVELEDAPLARVLGPGVGEVLAEVHRVAGVDLHLQTSVSRFAGDGRLRAVELTNGRTIEADLAVVALGAVPNVEWLRGSGLHLDRGVVCGPDLGVQGADGVVAAGDLTRWPHALFDGERVSVGHWSNAVEQARAAAQTLLDGPSGAKQFAAIPTFWSELHGLQLRSAGLPQLGDEVYVVEGTPEEGRFVAVYGRSGVLVGALAVNMNRRLRFYRALIEQRSTVGDALQVAAQQARDAAGAETG